MLLLLKEKKSGTVNEKLQVRFAPNLNSRLGWKGQLFMFTIYPIN